MTLVWQRILKLTLNAKITKEKKIDKLDYINLIFHAKNITKKVKKQPTDWVKIFANHISDKDLPFKIQKKKKTHVEFNNKIKRRQLKNDQRLELNEISPKKIYKCLTST